MLETSILIVDDEARMRKLIKDFLVQKGHTRSMSLLVCEKLEILIAGIYFFTSKL